MKFKLLLKDSFVCLIISLIFIGLISFVFLNLSFLNPFTNAFKDFSFLDLYYSQRTEKQAPSAAILLVNVENKNRYEISQLLDHITQSKAKLIGVDIIFKEAKNAFVDSLLNKSLQHKKVIVSKAYLTDRWQYNAPVFKTKENTGYSNLNFNNKSDVIRTFEGKKQLKNNTHYSFSSLLAKSYKPKQWISNNLENKIEKPLYINYYGNYTKFNTLTYAQALNQNKAIFKDKLVLLGYLGTPLGNPYDIEDKFFTPLNSKTSGKSIPDTYGVTIHANIIKMLLDNSFIYILPKWITNAVALLLAYFSIMLFIYLSIKSPTSYMLLKKIMQLGITVILLWLSILLFSKQIVLKPESIIVLMVISVEMIGVYKIIAKKLNKKYQWKSYFFHSY